MTQQPPTGCTTPVAIVDIHDGDTVTVEITRRVTVRLLDCWAPQARIDPRVLAEHREAAKAAGIAARDYLRGMAVKSAEGSYRRQTYAVLHVPADSGDLSDILTLDRVIGRIWLPDDRTRDVSERMVAAGHATPHKTIWRPPQ